MALRKDMRKTKIICTIGPASRSEEKLRDMIAGGMDIARLNTSHSGTKEIIETVKKIRKISKALKKNTAVILDLQGPKIRIGELKDKVDLKDGQKIIFTTRVRPGSGFPDASHTVPVTYSKFVDDVNRGDRIFIDDGLIECKILQVDKDKKYVLCEVITGGPLGSYKGINLPGVKVSVNSVTKKDLQFLDLGLELEVDFIAQSFIRDAGDVKKIKSRIKQKGKSTMLIAKIEKREAVNSFDDILEISDAIMVARGDLGIEMAAEEVPHTQKEIIKKANMAGKPVITATQMLDSMMRNPRPTRAEVSDVANAIIDGSDAVMLSGETAAGKHPLCSLRMMVRIIKETEKNLDYSSIMRNNTILRKKLNIPHNTITEAISFASVEVSNILDVKTIISSTESGFTARQVSKNRPKSIIIGASPNYQVVRQLMLSWGVIPVKTKFSKNIDMMIEEDIKIAKKLGYIMSGDIVVITAGVMVNKPGSTNLINVREIQ